MARRRRPPLAADAPIPTAEGGTGDIDLVVLRAQLRSGLSRISMHHRRAVIETILLDRPYADVATELGSKTGTLRTRVHYALRRLRAELECDAC